MTLIIHLQIQTFTTQPIGECKVITGTSSPLGLLPTLIRAIATLMAGIYFELIHELSKRIRPENDITRVQSRRRYRSKPH